MRLIRVSTGQAVKVGDHVTSISMPAGLAVVLEIIPPHKSDSSGKVRVKWLPEKPGHEGVYYVTVFGLEFV